MFQLNDFLTSPLFDHALLTKSLALFTLFLLAIRRLPAFARNLVLLLASVALIEIATSPFYTFLFVAFSSGLYYCLFWIQWSPRKREISYVLAFALVLLYFLLLDWPLIQTPWTGPMVHNFGIAYSLIRLLTLIFDVGRGRTLPAEPLDFFVYAFFAPTFFQGPIERLDEFRENLDETTRPQLTLADSGSHLIRIVIGILKGWCVLKFLTPDWKAYFDYPQNFTYGILVWGMYVRAVGFYILVSAANDLTIGCSAMAGYRLHENYDYPYFKRNLAEFWRSWHITLVRFIRDYIYIPLGGNRRHIYFNFLVIFFAIAMWHVTSKAFVVWGLWHGVGMCLLRAWQNFWKRVEAQKGTPPLVGGDGRFWRPEGAGEGTFWSLQQWSRRHPTLVRIASTVFTFHYVALGWLPFWGGHPQGLSMILRIVSGNRWRLFEW